MAISELPQGNALQPVQQGQVPAKKKYKLKPKMEESGLEESPEQEDVQDKDLTKKLLRFLGGKLPS